MADDDWDNSSEDEQNLENRICTSLATSKFDAPEQEFLPENCIEDLITRDTIRKELRIDEDPANRTNDVEQLVEWIHGEAKKVFAITVQCHIRENGIVAAMSRFRTFAFIDKCLPVENLSRQNRQTLPPHFYSKHWISTRLFRFWEQQWKCLAPVFDVNTYTHDLSSKHLFPFIWKDESFKEGAFSCVYRVKIHPAHQKHKLDEVRTPWSLRVDT
jgi:hypothetical protein